jgi:hypothetical protein
MRGNGDFEAISPTIWEFDFMKRWKHSDFFVGKSVYSSSGRAIHAFGVATLLRRGCPA